MFKTLTIITALLSVLSQPAIASKDRGGGNGVGDELFDFYENRGTQVINIAELPAYKNMLRQILDDLDLNLPGIKSYLLEATHEIDWLIESKELSDTGCNNSSIIKAKKTIIACQTLREVRISENWLSRASLKSRAGLIMHELLVYQVLKKSFVESVEERSMADIRRINRAIFSDNNFTAENIQKLFREANLETFPSFSELGKVQSEKDIALKKACESPDRSPKQVLKLINKFSLSSMDLRNSISLQHAYRASANEMKSQLGRGFAASTDNICKLY